MTAPFAIMTFTKGDWGWDFTTRAGIRFRAHRDEAGFAHRAWELWRWNPVIGTWIQEYDQLGSRAECVRLAKEAFE